jgi:hypothetical protein
MPPSSTKRNHEEVPSTTEISRRTLGAPSSGQLIKILQSPKWTIECVVWDEDDWQRIPEQISSTLRELKREIGLTTASRFLVSVVRRG